MEKIKKNWKKNSEFFFFKMGKNQFFLNWKRMEETFEKNGNFF